MDTQINMTIDEDLNVDVCKIEEPDWEKLIDPKKEININIFDNKKCFANELSDDYFLILLSYFLFHKEYLVLARVNKYLNKIIDKFIDNLCIKNWMPMYTSKTDLQGAHYIHMFKPISIEAETTHNIKYLWLNVVNDTYAPNVWKQFVNSLPDLYGFFIIGTPDFYPFHDCKVPNFIFTKLIKSIRHLFLYNIYITKDLFTKYLANCQQLCKLGISDVEFEDGPFDFQMISINEFRNLKTLEVYLPEIYIFHTEYLTRYLLTSKTIKTLKIKGNVELLNTLLDEKIFNIENIFISTEKDKELFNAFDFLVTFPSMFIL